MPPTPPTDHVTSAAPALHRSLGLVALVATGLCSMIGAGVHIVPIMLQRSVPGIGQWVLVAFAIAAVPAVLAGLAYAILGSAMPVAGGSYVYASRGLSPYLGFVASVSQWFGLSIAIGVVSYVLVPFLRDVAAPAGLTGLAAALDRAPVHLGVSLATIALFTWVNMLGLKAYERTIVPLIIATLVLGALVIIGGFGHDQATFAAAAAERDGRAMPPLDPAPFDVRTLASAAAVLFSSFIGFDAIAQAGGEAENPGRNIPRAILLAIAIAGAFYLAFTAAVHHTVPWQYIAREAQGRDLTATGLLGYVLSPGWTIAIAGGAALALAKDLPSMILSVSRLMFAWAEDGIAPRALAEVHPRRRTPTRAILASAAVAAGGVLGSHFAGDFFLGIDILVLSMLVNFLLMCLAVLALPSRNPALAARVTVLPSRGVQVPVAVLGVVVIGAFLVVHVARDLSSERAWWLRSTPTWLAVMGVATLLYLREMRALRRAGTDVAARFSVLPPA